jgi:hypothetical protein
MLTDDETIHAILSATEQSRVPPLASVQEICTRLLAAEARVKRLEEALLPFSCDCGGRCEKYPWMPADNATCPRSRASAALQEQGK